MLNGKAGQTEKAFEIIDEIFKITKSINDEDRIQKVMINLTEATQDLKITALESRKLISEFHAGSGDKLNDSMKRLDSILTKIDKGEGTLGALINDPSVHERLKVILGTENHRQSIQSLIRDSIKNDKN